MRAIWRLLFPFLISYTLTRLWGRSATSPFSSPWSTKLSQHSSASNPGWQHELTGLLLPVILMYGSFLPATSNTQHISQASGSQSTLRHLKVINSPVPAVLFQPLLGMFLSQDHRSPCTVSSNHYTDEPSHLVSISSLENKTSGWSNRIHNQVVV